MLHFGETGSRAHKISWVYNDFQHFLKVWASQAVLVVTNPPANAGDLGDAGSFPGLGRSPGEGNGNPLQYSCLGNSMDRGAWRATVHWVTKSRTWLRDWAPPWPANFKQNKTLGPQAKVLLLSLPPSPLTRWVSTTELLCHEEVASQKATWDELAGMFSVSRVLGIYLKVLAKRHWGLLPYLGPCSGELRGYN